MSAGTVSGAALALEVRGKASARVVLKRHLSPRTVGALLRALPLEGNAHRLGPGAVYFGTPVRSGVERPRREFRAGDVAFMPAGGSVCVFTRDMRPGREMSPIGRVDGPAAGLERVEAGDVVSLYAAAG